ncbi:L-aspartate oxidase [Agaricicola taiwanensis]|uniref:L-aspartate oxidase n=1 Tax=Agaricicola taiwanensis TaxID=591372 RepID=A0A8J2YIJ3_9RHOB|nr:L-aspartate oxidase [Agaricicola taiwanensis]GGE45043.1 L-aspartate oxidase [Agaricicola taiwanensis]
MPNSSDDGISLQPESWAGLDEIVIVGGGLAGLFCALKLAPRPVTIVTTAPIGEGASSAWAQGGIAAAIGEGDTPEAHASDTIAAGAGLVDHAIAHLIANEASRRIEDLLSYGVPFDRDIEGKLALSREAAHNARRIVRVKGDGAGRAIMQALVATVRRTPSIRVLEHVTLEELTTEGRYVTGLIAHGPRGRVAIPARAVVLATGGIGQLFSVTTNPPEAFGAGLAAAARAGAAIMDAEFVQFHPTAIDVGRDPAPLASEALRGDGAVLINSAGERFMKALHPDAELAPRDIVARGVFAEVVSGRGAFLDCREAIGQHFVEHFPTITAACRSAGIDPVTQAIPIATAAHYHMGGVLTDADGRTSLDGLWACGEVACTGAHGANRLASNSLLEAIVFAARVAENIESLLPASAPAVWSRSENGASAAAATGSSDEVADLRQVMSNHAGVIRTGDGLAHAAKYFAGRAREARGADIRNRATAGLLVTASALRRKESRGGHYRSDYPEADPALATRQPIFLDEAFAIADAVKE